VKNLESVQGDERDIMYFSVTYGPDLAGSVSMNLGPMNRDGGERRLNVAITRARHELLVFSSLRPEQIDLSRTQAVGVLDLKHFLEFAERGPKAIAEAVYGTIGDYDSPFEKAVAEALASKGWQVHPQVGVSSFRIDIGVVDPDAPGRYLAGVECDGATYHRSATARDRDKLREYVLRELGWEILRIWSTDWWIDAAGALEKVHSDLEKLLDNSRIQRAEEERKRKEAAESGVMTEGKDTEEGSDEEMVDSTSTTQEFYEPLETESMIGSVVPISASEVSPGSPQYSGVQQKLSETKLSNTPFLSYQIYEGPPCRDPRDASIVEIVEGLCRIIKAEAPMLSKRAYDIYLRDCGIKRMGRELKRTMNKALHNTFRQGHIVVEDELNTKDFVHAIVRITGTPPVILRERGPRRFEEIPPSEVLVASHLVMKNYLLQKGSDEHLHRILEMFDLKRLTTQTGTRLLEIIELEFDYVTDWLRNHDIDTCQ
jgi:very-short-patch-repair endonuclease